MTQLTMAPKKPVESDPDPALADSMQTGRITGMTPLKTLRRERQITTVDLARISGLSHDEVVSLENGAPFNAVQIYALAAALNVSPETLAPEARAS